MIRFLVQVVFLVLVFIAAWRAGGKPEKHVACIYVSMLVLDLAGAAVLDDPHAGLQESQTYRFVLDLAALVAVVIVSLRYDRWWTLWVGSVQLIAVVAHLLKMTGLSIPPLVYGVMERWPVWIGIALTGLGTLLHWRRSILIGRDT